MEDVTFTPLHRGGCGPPLLLLHGFMDTWRVWELVLPMLERARDVLALTLPGHAGGPPLRDPVGAGAVLDAVEQALDEAGLQTVHVAGNSLGGYVALRLAERGRARSVVALAPAGGWDRDDPSRAGVLRMQKALHAEVRAAAANADVFVSTPQGRRRATRLITCNYEHIPPALLARQIVGVAACRGAAAMLEQALHGGYEDLDAERVACPVRIVWGTEDRLLPWPASAVRLRRDWLPHADWVVLDGVGHCPQLDVPLETAQLILDFTAR